jgi:hypothetical protein
MRTLTNTTNYSGDHIESSIDVLQVGNFSRRSLCMLVKEAAGLNSPASALLHRHARQLMSKPFLS